MPLNKFIECDVDGNYAALIVSGYPHPDTLLNAWLLIKGDYADAIGNNEYIMYRNIFKDITALTLSLSLINSAVEILEKVYSKELADRLNKALGTSFKLDHTDPVKYRADLKSCIMRSKSIKIKIDMLEIQSAEMTKKHVNGEATTREYYQSLLITLSDHSKYPVKDSITVFEFCDRIKRYNKYCEQEKQRLTKKR